MWWIHFPLTLMEALFSTSTVSRRSLKLGEKNPVRYVWPVIYQYWHTNTVYGQLFKIYSKDYIMSLSGYGTIAHEKEGLSSVDVL